MADLESKKTPLRATLAQAEDEDRPTAQPLAAYQKVKSDIETGQATAEKVDADLKLKLGEFLDSQLADYPKQKSKLVSERTEILKNAGESIGQAVIALRTLGPEGAAAGRGLLAALRQYSDICAPVIASFSATVNANESKDISAMHRLHQRLEYLTQNPTEKGKMIDKYFHAVIKDDTNFLLGL